MTYTDKKKNILITYFSKSGNTKKLADQLADVLKNRNLSFDYINIKHLNLDDIHKYDIFMIGSPCHSRDIVPIVKKLLRLISKMDNKKVFLFVTHSTDISGKYYDIWASGCEKTFNQIINKNNILGYYHCQGKPNLIIKNFIKFVVFRKNKSGWLKYKTDMMNHPDNKDLEELKNFANKII